MKEKSQNLKNVFMVVTSNILTIVVNLFNGFVIPKQLEVTEYAYYRVYMLYIAYAGLMHLGFVNGIYLKYGKYNQDDLPKEKFRSLGMVMFVLQSIVVLILGVALFATRNGMDRNVAIAYAFLIINIPLVNIKWFYSSINQFTKMFVRDSYVTYAQNLMMLAMVIIITVTKWYNFIVILTFTTIINFVCMLAVMIQNHSIVIGKQQDHIWNEAKSLIQSGFFLMLSEFVAIIILGIDSIFVQNLFSTEEFAMYSFAVSIISVIYSMISVVSNLVYPYLVRADETKYAVYYTLMSDVLTFFSLMSLLSFFIAKFIVVTWVGQYTRSLEITAILFGTIVFRTIIMLVGGNYFKALKLVKLYSYNNVFAIVLSIILNMIAYFSFGDYRYIAYASLASFIIWYLVTDYTFVKRLCIKPITCIRRYLCIIVSECIFYLVYQQDSIRAFIIYGCSTLVACLFFFRKQIAILVNQLKAGKNDEN